jgi:uncharacterized membrane protein YphA (DoxX/SURF4 family)
MQRLTTPWWILRVGLGAAAFLAGLDKFFNLLTTGHYFDVAVRDVVMALAAFTLARLTEAGVGAEARDRVAASRSLAGRATIGA